ncbi:glycosyltransferase family 2 protein [Epibacterium sp. MM17-32]|uniref:glycosyltransferase family 2 protein n=1 Tax=Epibacterium sp. MM17-32 TaxID=2917734 RepID=UPI001EF62C74|nr:glycosyltransferase family 2 protein [Epibacterium sp. MM17-32]
MSADALPRISVGAAYRLRWKRRRCLWRALRARHRLQQVVNNTRNIKPGDVVVVVVLRNEHQRLPHFLQYYRDLGAGHFLIVDNNSTDGSSYYVRQQAGTGDISIWRTADSYRDSRFGVDWAGWLLMRYGHGRWCLTVDADELLTYDGIETHDLRDLAACLERRGQIGFGALLLDLFPKGPLGRQTYAPGQDPTSLLNWFDPGPFRSRRQAPRGNLWVQGGTRDRVFFAQSPDRAPTLNKIPLIRWNRRYAYTNSTHALLPRHLNMLYGGPGAPGPSGVLLHTKFLPEVVQKSGIEQGRRQHFHMPDLFDDYYNGIQKYPDLWHPGALRYQGPEQLVDLGLCGRIAW